MRYKVADFKGSFRRPKRLVFDLLSRLQLIISILLHQSGIIVSTKSIDSFECFSGFLITWLPGDLLSLNQFFQLNRCQLFISMSAKPKFNYNHLWSDQPSPFPSDPNELHYKTAKHSTIRHQPALFIHSLPAKRLAWIHKELTVPVSNPSDCCINRCVGSVRASTLKSPPPFPKPLI